MYSIKKLGNFSKLVGCILTIWATEVDGSIVLVQSSALGVALDVSSTHSAEDTSLGTSCTVFFRSDALGISGILSYKTLDVNSVILLEFFHPRMIENFGHCYSIFWLWNQNVLNQVQQVYR